MYTGEMMDANALVYLRARYYHPGLGVFTSLDPVEKLNLYQYVGGNVVNAVDPSGMFAWGSSMTEQGDSCYCIGREAGIPDSHLENFAIWLKNHNSRDVFMSDNGPQKYWLYPEKTITLPNSFANVANVQDAGMNKRGGCHCPQSVESGRCTAATNPVYKVEIDDCKCPDGWVWDPIMQICGHPCPSGEVRPPGGVCPGFHWEALFPDYPNPGIPNPGSMGQTPTRSRDCNPFRSLNPQIYGIVTDLSLYVGQGVGGSIYVMTDGNEIAIYGGLETGGGFSADLLPFLEVILSPFIEGLILGREPWNIYSEADLNSFAGTISKSNIQETLAFGARVTYGPDRARYTNEDCIFTDIQGWDVAYSVTVSVSTTWELKRIHIPSFKFW